MAKTPSQKKTFPSAKPLMGQSLKKKAKMKNRRDG